MTPTATPDSDGAPRRSLLTWLLPALVVLVAVGVAIFVTRQPGEDPPPEPTEQPSAEPEAVEVSSDAPTFSSLDELIEASDLIVRAEVVATDRGRFFGDGSSSARIQSRLVTLDVSEVFSGDVPAGDLGTILVEEEGWLEDGSPLVVDGAAPSEVGDEGFWFLVDPGDDTTDALIAVNSQGRYLVDGDHLAGASGADALIGELEGLSPGGLADRLS